ncbi:AAA family ATPase [Mycobacterium sp.]|uniref:AAA family ATPase n=1 Tax=Mycobacterium sp. TaxID=1785 RepID=UPI003BB0342D
MDPGGDGGVGLNTAPRICGSCGAQSSPAANFCGQCGAQLAKARQSAEYKQVTVLFADVVHSMDIAAAVGAERLREIMADLADRCAAVVQRYGGTVDKFTGDGIMAVFGAPVALEDHAIRACLAGLGIQAEAQQLAVGVQNRDGVQLGLRVGLNSGQVIAGEIGSGPFGYTSIGEQVGMAQRMESIAPPGGVMLSESTARLAEHAVVLGDPEMVGIKGAVDPVATRRLLAIADHQPRRRSEPTLVGRRWELNTLAAILDEAVNGAGCIVNVIGPSGIGKSRLVREAASIAAARGVEVMIIHCESHARDIPFHALARLLRAGTQTTDLGAEAARAQIRNRFRDADPEDLVLLEDLLGIRDAGDALPEIAADARRRRLTALINSASLDRGDPALYLIEDVQWIDEVSESILVDFLAVIPRTPSVSLITYRPEYRGALTRISGAQAIALRPLSDADAADLAEELLGADPSVASLAATVAERAAGNPFFAEEMVRDLAERGVLDGELGSYRLRNLTVDASVPATLQATIGARIDRLVPAAKRTLNAASVIGTVFDDQTLKALHDDVDVGHLMEAELVDQVRFSPRVVYAFRHPMIRSVAYESQLRSDRAQLHRRLATTIEQTDEKASLIAQHYEAAGDLRAAFEWHMRAGAWLNNRDNTAAHTSWRNAQSVADRLPQDEPDRVRMRIAPRTLLCATVVRSSGTRVDSGFDELRELCIAAGDERSLAIGMAGRVLELFFNARRREASQLATEHARLLESIGDPTLTIAVLGAAASVKHETAEISEVLRFAERIIDLARGDPTMGGTLQSGSPLALAIALRGLARSYLGIRGAKDDFRQAVTMASPFEAVTRTGAMFHADIAATINGMALPDETTLRETAESLTLAEQSGEDVALGLARCNRAVALVQGDGTSRELAVELLLETRDNAVQRRYSMTGIQTIDVVLAQERLMSGDLNGAIELARATAENLFDEGGLVWIPVTTAVLVDALLQRGAPGDLEEAGAATDRLAVAPMEPGIVLRDVVLLRLRALLARSRCDEVAYRDLRDRYRETATKLGFEGHMKYAEAMP